jgi:hypothetical protein
MTIYLRMISLLSAIAAAWCCLQEMDMAVIQLMLASIWTYLISDPWKKGGAA